MPCEHGIDFFEPMKNLTSTPGSFQTFSYATDDCAICLDLNGAKLLEVLSDRRQWRSMATRQRDTDFRFGYHIYLGLIAVEDLPYCAKGAVGNECRCRRNVDLGEICSMSNGRNDAW